jgi:hypothetical protein
MKVILRFMSLLILNILGAGYFLLKNILGKLMLLHISIPELSESIKTLN